MSFEKDKYEVVKKAVPTDEAVEELIELIKQHGDWVEPELEESR